MARLKNTFTPPDWNKNKDGAKPVEVASDLYTAKTWTGYWVDVIFSNNLYYLWAPMMVIGIVIGSNVVLTDKFQYVPLFCLGTFFALTVLGFMENSSEHTYSNTRLDDDSDTDPDSVGRRTFTKGVISPTDVYND
jgi:hypothetical protein